MSEDVPTKTERKDQTYADLNPFKLPKATDKAPPWVPKFDPKVINFCCLGSFFGAVLLFFSMAVLLVAQFGLALLDFSSGDAIASEKIRNTGLILAALIGLPFLILRTMNLQRQTNIQQESHYTQLYTEAIKQLGAGKRSKERVKYNPKTKRDEPDPDKWGRTIVPSDEGLELRLGAIYALERIARESRKDHWPIMEVLCAFIRSNPVKAIEVPEINDHLVGGDLQSALDKLRDAVEALPSPALDIQAAMDVIGRRTYTQIEWEEKNRANELDRSLNLSEANLQKINASRGRFEHANFNGADCQGADFSESRCQGASFEDARCRGASFEDARCQGASFEDARCQGARFVSASCQDAFFVNARFQGASFVAASCQGATFVNARCQRADFRGAHCQSASFRFANCQSADFYGAQIQGVYLLGAELADVKNVTQDQIEVAVGTKDIALPEWLSAPDFWPEAEDPGMYRLRSAINNIAITPPFTREKITALFPDFYDGEGEGSEGELGKEE
ncbi:MAG: pentapeptide repeat-containing protein [Pseudomonadota bacterium]